MKQIIFASGNSGKLQEVCEVLQSLPYNIISQKELKISSAEETGLTFIENAILKARHASKCGDLPALADDSGLVIDSLGGAPGIYSARYAGLNANSEDNIKKVLHELEDVDEMQRMAHFYCAMVYLRHHNDPEPLVATGIWNGRILLNKQGENGFGYDPIFFVPDHNCSAAELPKDVKNRISHRGQALQKLVQVM